MLNSKKLHHEWEKNSLRHKKANKTASELTPQAKVNAILAAVTTLEHEVNQPLMAMKAYVEGCINHLQQGSNNNDSVIAAMVKVSQHVNQIANIFYTTKHSLIKAPCKK